MEAAYGKGRSTFGLALLVVPTFAKSPTRLALERLYESAHGSEWQARSRWLSSFSVCKWHGIECASGSQQVTSVDLGGNGVRGTLPAQLGQLTALRVLNIDESRLSGTLPATLASSTQLHTILLASNPRLSGTLPAYLGTLASLSVLDVSNTRVSGSLSSALGQLRQLERLQLDRSAVAGTVPTTLGSLTRAASIFMHACPALSGTLPTELGRATALLHGASFASTRISGTVPTQIGRLSSLRALWLVNASLSGTLPRAMGQLRALRQLELHANRLSGSLPSQLSHLATTLKACVLTSAQGPHQPRHSMRPVDRPREDTNRFACPLPAGLPPPCLAHLSCHEQSASSFREDGGKRHGGRGRRREVRAAAAVRAAQ